MPLYKNEHGDGAVATLNVRLEGLTLTSISAFDEFFAHSLDNYDGYPAADNNWTKNFQQQQFSEELRLGSVSDSRSLLGWGSLSVTRSDSASGLRWQWGGQQARCCSACSRAIL